MAQNNNPWQGYYQPNSSIFASAGKGESRIGNWFDKTFSQPTPVSQDGSWDWGKPNPVTNPDPTAMFNGGGFPQGDFKFGSMTQNLNNALGKQPPTAPAFGSPYANGDGSPNGYVQPLTPTQPSSVGAVGNNLQQQGADFYALRDRFENQQVSPTGSGQLPQAGTMDIMQALQTQPNNITASGIDLNNLTQTFTDAEMANLARGEQLGGTTDYSTGMFGGMFNDDPNSGWWDEASGKDKFGMGMDIVGMGAGLYSMFQNQRNQKGTLDVAKGHLGVARDKLAMQQGEFDLTNKRRGVA